MRYKLDTYRLIYLIKNKPPSVAARIDALDPGHELCMYFFTYAELLKGAEHVTLLRAAGTPIADHKLWIAYHALADDCTVVTNNRREFERVQGLGLENWTQ